MSSRPMTNGATVNTFSLNDRPQTHVFGSSETLLSSPFGQPEHVESYQIVMLNISDHWRREGSVTIRLMKTSHWGLISYLTAITMLQGKHSGASQQNNYFYLVFFCLFVCKCTAVTLYQQIKMLQGDVLS